MSHSDIVYTHNGLGWTSTIPNQITCEWLDFIHKGQEQPMRVLDIGAGFGVASIPALKHGARVIANDIERSHLGRFLSSLSSRWLRSRSLLCFPIDFGKSLLSAKSSSDVRLPPARTADIWGNLEAPASRRSLT